MAATRVFCPSSRCSASRSVEHSSSPASLLPLATTNSTSNTPPPVHGEKEVFLPLLLTHLQLWPRIGHHRGVKPWRGTHFFRGVFRAVLECSPPDTRQDNMRDWKDTEYVYDLPQASLCGPVSSAFRAETRAGLWKRRRWRRRRVVVVLGGLARFAFLCNKRTCAQLSRRNHRPGAFLITVPPLLQPLFERFHSLIVFPSPSPSSSPVSPSASHSACFLRPD